MQLACRQLLHGLVALRSEDPLFWFQTDIHYLKRSLTPAPGIDYPAKEYRKTPILKMVDALKHQSQNTVGLRGEGFSAHGYMPQLWPWQACSHNLNQCDQVRLFSACLYIEIHKIQPCGPGSLSTFAFDHDDEAFNSCSSSHLLGWECLIKPSPILGTGCRRYCLQTHFVIGVIGASTSEF